VTGLTSVFSNVVNELRVEYASTRATKIPVTPTGLGFSFPSITYGSSFIFEHEDEDRTEIVDDVVIHKTGWKGSHDFKFGGSASPYIPTSAKWWWCPDGCYTFSADVPGFPAVQPNFDQLSAAGQIQQLFIGLIPNAPVINYPVYGWYVQDDWTPMSKLTLNLGMRWDAQWNSMLHELDGEPFIGTLKLPGYDRTTRKRDLNNFAPRFGFAYELNEQTVLRGSAGIYYSMLPNLPLYIEPRDRDGIDTNSVVISNPHLTNWTDPLAEIGDPKQYHDARPSISVNANDMVNPDSRQYGLGITRQLTATLSLKADVVKVDGKHELRNRNLNALGMPNGVRQTDEFGVITEQVTTGHSDYKALLMSLEKRMSDKYQFMLSYTLASAKNTLGSMWEGIGDTNRPEDEYGAAIADRRQRFVFSGITTAIPWGIQVSGVLSLGSPRPFDVRAGVDLNLDGDFNDRPPGVTRDQGCRDLSLDAINAFRAANGVAPVSGVECPNAADLDVRVSKPIRFGGSKSLELMFEVFNLTGADNLNHPDSQGVTQHQALSNVFGKAIIAGPPRQAQLAVRFSF
jgi:hypothetical protein